MLGREPVSLEWLSTEALRLPGPSAVSRGVANEAEMEYEVEALLSGCASPVAADLAAARREAVEQLFFANDGRASERVAQVVLRALERPAGRRAPRRAARSVVVELARGVVGYSAMQRLRKRHAAKAFEAGEVQAILRRIAQAGGSVAETRAAPFPSGLVARPRRFSGKSLQVVAG
jgi:hypothetical protein